MLHVNVSMSDILLINPMWFLVSYHNKGVGMVFWEHFPYFQLLYGDWMEHLVTAQHLHQSLPYRQDGMPRRH